MSTESFEFLRNGDVRQHGEYIGRFEGDGRLALTEENRRAEIAAEVFAALHEQMHIGEEYEPSGGWPMELVVGEDLRETNV